MQILLDWKNIAYLFSQFIGYLVGLALIISGLKGKKSNIFLGFNFLFLTYSSFIIWLITTGYFVEFPQLYRTGNFTGLLFIPLMFLYIRHEITKKPFTLWTLVHLLPALVFLVDFWPIYMLPVDEKLSLIKSEIADPTLFTQFSQSRFFPANFYTPFRSLLNAAYWLLSVYWVRVGTRNASNSQFAKEWFVWIWIFLGLQSMVFLPALLLKWMITPLAAYYLAHLSIVLLNLVTGVALLFFPKLLYGLDKERYEEKQQTRRSKTEMLDQLSGNKIEEIRTVLDRVLCEEKKYLRQGYTIADLSKDTGIPSYLLTFYINKNLSSTFPDLINKARIEECCRMMESGNYPHFATEGFAQLCGFNNRNSFSAAFKKFKGITPAAYMKSLEH